MAQVTRFAARAEGPLDRLADFMAHLRLNGFRLGVAETAAAAQAMTAIDPTDPAALRSALRAVCAGSRDEAQGFDDLFAAFWFNTGRTRPRHQPAAPKGRKSPFVSAALGFEGAGTPDSPDPDPAPGAETRGEGTGRLMASTMARIGRTDLRSLVSPEDMAAAEATALRLAQALRHRRQRRQIRARRGARIDLRRVLRAALATGGEPLRLHHRRRLERPLRIVVLLDVSGSMQVYARVFLAFLRGLAGPGIRADAYLFHTRLTRITEALSDPDPLRALDRMTLMAQGQGGGTRIATALRAFNRGYGARVDGRTAVLILSDGYDTDPPEDLAAELARLRRRGCRLLWLNPLRGWQGYAPVARGMAAALPHLHLFAAANTLESLAALEPELARL